MAENTTAPVTMEIINSEQFKRANIRFNGKPAEEIREELKKEGWFYSRNHNVWYPKNDAAENSLNFANHIKETYFPENQEVKIITEASEKDELAAMVKNGSSLNDILSKLSDMYGEDAVHEAFNEARTTLSNTDSTPKVNVIPFLNEVDPKTLEIVLYNKNLDNYLFIQSSDEYGWDFTSYDKDFKEIDGGVSDDVPETQYTEDIREAAKSIIKSLYPESDYPDWEQTNLANFQSKVEEVEAAAYDKAVESAQKNWEDHNNGVEQANDERESKEMNAELSRLDAEAEAMERANGLREMEVSTGSTTAEIDDTGLTPEQKEIRIAQSKFGDIVRGTFLALSDEEKEKVTTLEQKNARYEKWFRPMVDEIMTEIGNGNKEVMAIVQNFDLNHESHVQGNKWYSPNEAYTRDVQYKLLPEMYEKVQDRIKKEYEEKKIPYVVMYSSESPKFPSENKVYTVKEFNEILLQADSEFHNRKKYAEEKYGSADNYWDLERDDKLPEEDKGIQFGYDKTNFKFFNIPNPNNPEDTFSYEPSRYDIGDGNGSVFDYVRSTCSHDEFIEALNALETQLYFPGVTDSQRQFVEKTVEEATQNLKATLKEKMEDLDKAQNEYKELHKKWLIEATEADRVDEMLKNALDGVKDAYDSSMNDAFTKVLNEYPFASGDVAGSEFLKYTANEVKKMAVSELYLPSRNAQKAMNAEDYKTYNSIDWAKLRRIWEKFPANVNMTAYAEKLLQDKCAEKGMSVSENTKAVTPPETTTEVHTDNEIPLKEFIDSDMTFDEEDTILHNKVTGKYVWLYRETGGGVGKFEYDSSFNETAREPLSYAGMKSIIRGAILEKNMDDWTIFKDKRYFKPFQESEMSEEEREEFKQSVTSDNKSVTKETELSPEDIELCKKVIPPAQFKFTMELTEGEFFRNKMKEIADTYRRINTDSELINEDGTHNVGFRYFLGDTEIFLSEIDSDGIGFGYNILNGDLQMSEWGSTSLEEIMKIPYIEMDYHVPEGMTIEAMLHKEHPDYFEAPAVKKDTEIESSETKTIRAEYPNGLDQGDIENHVSKTQKDQISKEVLKLERERGWAFNYDELLDYINQYEKAVNSNDWETIYKIDYHLTDSNFHTECSLLAEYKFEECRKLIAKNFNITLKDESVSWDELKNFFKDNLRDWQTDFDTTKQEVQNEKYETEREEKEETAGRLLIDNLNWADYAKDGQDTKDDELAAKVLEEKWSIVEAVEAEIVTGRVKNFDEAQIMVNDKMLNSELYKEVHEKLNSKPYNFFVNDTANLDLGIGAEFEPVTGLTAEQAVLKYAELKEKGLSPYIGLNIPGDIVFDDKEGQGAGIFTETEGKPSFYIGDNFVKGLKENDEHAQNVLAAYKELYENADKYILGVEKPNFVFDKESELNKPAEPLRVYTFSPFGYEGTIVQVETDLRRGIPAYDIVGIADSAVKETRERIRAAFTNSGLDFPSERVLQSLSPADLRKDSPMDLSMALGILGQTKQYPVNEPVLALGELELSGRIRPVRGAVAAVNSAKAAGITNIVCDPTTAELLKDIDGIKILTAENLKEANEKLMDAENFQKTEPKLYKAETVQFNEEWMEDYKEALENLPIAGHFETIRAIEIAVAGKHNILTTGAPGCGKTLLTQTLMPALTPKMTEEESRQITRINSLAGLDSPKRDKLVPPFRMPHQTATIEGICGGGPNCRPGEISLAHQGTLFMDETAEFRSSVIQMLRVPLESRQITLSRAGRSTSYPADFQLAMTMNPCPCGCYGSPDKICLDSARSIEMYWKKISDPLLDRVEIKTFVQKDEKDTRKMSIDELKTQIATAYEIQRKRGVYNSHMTPEEIQKYCKLDKEGQAYLDKEEDKLTPRGKSNLLKLSLTIANMDGREEIRINDLKEARELSAPVFEKPRKFIYKPNQSDKVNVSVNNEGYLSKPVDNFLELLTSTTTEKSEAHVFERDAADKQIEFLKEEQKTWGTNNSFKIESLPEAHEEIDGYSKDSKLKNYPNLGSKNSKTYKTSGNWGGARVGAGRKPTGLGTETFTICLSILQSEELKRRAKEANLTVSKYLAKELKLDNADIEEINKILEKAKNQKITAKPVPLESSLTLDDANISRSQISDAEKERSRITEPVLNGERTGMYKAFKDFEDKGVFDIQGTTVKLSKNGGLTPTGWKQLHAAMEIYRSKKFETFRYIMIDRKTGEIADQLAITSHMPNFCNVSKPNDETLKQVISRAEEKDYLIAVCHNHPSGNTTESSFDRELTDSLDRSLRRNDGLNRFAGHIILDHDTFNLAVPSEARPGNCHWKKMEPMQVTEIDRFTAEPKPEWAGNYVGGTSALKEVAKKINETENWNDDFIPVVFTNADRNITGVQYYSKNFFENESDKIRNEFQFAAMEAGAIGAFPVITDSLWEKLGKGATDFEAVMKAHVMNDAFTDVAFNRTTMTEKYDIEAGRNYYSFYRDQSDRKIDVVSTWTPEVNPRLFPPEGVGEIRNEKVFATSNTAKIEKENFPKNQIYSKRKEIDFDR